MHGFLWQTVRGKGEPVFRDRGLLAVAGCPVASGPPPQPPPGLRIRPRCLSSLQLYYDMPSCGCTGMRPRAAAADAACDGYCPPEGSIGHPGAAKGNYAFNTAVFLIRQFQQTDNIFRASCGKSVGQFLTASSCFRSSPTGALRMLLRGGELVGLVWQGEDNDTSWSQ